jgi:hypothetical protein
VAALTVIATPRRHANVMQHMVGYWIGGLLILSGAFHGVVLLISGGAWEGPLSLRKPTSFGLSFGPT